MIHRLSCWLENVYNESRVPDIDIQQVYLTSITIYCSSSIISVLWGGGCLVIRLFGLSFELGALCIRAVVVNAIS